jgi:uncharacterized membrane protein
MEKFKGIGLQPEFYIVLIISVILLLGGVAAVYLGIQDKFNFNYSNIIVNGTHIQEELHFNPDKAYHTLFRNFASLVYWKDSPDIFPNSVAIENIQCSVGNAYIRDYSGMCYNPAGSSNCYSYTENNEYGCAFGDDLGFSKGEEYIINSEYELHPENLFKINNNYYIKFVAYSSENHIRLDEKNLVVQGNVIKNKKYFSDQNVILYIPYIGDKTSFNIIELKNFEFDSNSKHIWKEILFVFFSFFPGIFFFILWFILGREISYEEVPSELSTFPNKRKFWEVAAYFNPPFLKVGKNFFSTTLLNFYNKKIIDIKEKNKEIYIKLNKFQGDEIEKEVYDILENIKANLKSNRDKDIVDGEYFNLKKAMNDNPSLAVYKRFTNLQDKIKNEGKTYIKENSSKMIIISSLFVILIFAIAGFMSSILISLYILTFLIMVILPFTGAIFSKYNGEYYIEYQKWKAFKSYLKNSFSIKTATHKTIVIWNEYLIYATALGVPKRVIKELRNYNIINENQMNIYNGIIIGNAFGFSNGGAGGSSFGGGGFGGAGGGGVGGGGGGGR